MEKLSVFLIIVILLLLTILIVVSKANKDKIKKLKEEKEQQSQKYDSQILNMQEENQRGLGKLQEENQRNLGKLKFSSEIAFSNLNSQFEAYKKQVNDNFRKTIPYGEIILIKQFKELFETPGFDNCKIYGHLNMRDKETDKNYQADFLIVCSRGVFVVESKYWKGLTLIYSKWHSNIFSNTEFSYFGKGSGQEITVFNVNSDDDKNDTLKINKYNNPVTQARQYSVILSKHIKREVKNIVVFQQDGNCQIKIDDNDLNRYKVDEHTQITTQKNLISLLQNSYPDETQQIDIEDITDFVEKNFQYTMYLDSNNINQPPCGDFIF